MTRHLAIVGPTASGKSAVALAVAQAFSDVEIVSLDSMQVYRGLDIGTAKPTVSERASVPHHLVDVADPSEEWSVRATQRAARTAIDAIEARGHRALLVGGTGLYVRAVVDGLDVPPRDLGVRARLEQETATPSGLGRAYERLAAADPVAVTRIEPGNERRIVRALEVLEITGHTFSSFGSGLTEYGPPVIDIALVGIWLPRAELARRIEARFAAMRSGGLEAEVRALAALRSGESSEESPTRVGGTRAGETRRGGLSRTAAQAIGYKELLAHFDGEIATPAEAFELAVRRTRQFARRQRMWFRRDLRIQWLGTAGNPDALADVVMALWEPAPATLAADHS